MSEQIENKVAMVIIAHPDDAEFGAAGTVAAWAREGWEVQYVICTDGTGGGPDEATDVGPEARRLVAEARKREQRAACDILGVQDLVFLDYPDGQLEPNLTLRRDIVRVLRRYRPTRVIIQSPDRTWTPRYAIPRHHPDHLAAGRAALAAIYPASQNPWDFPELLEEGLMPHRVREIFIMAAPTVNFAVDIAETFEAKLEALRAHTSQTSASFERIRVMLREWATACGERHGLNLAEEFHRTEN